MKAYAIFDDFPESAISRLQNSGIEVIVHPIGVERPCQNELKRLLEEYDILIIGTGQVMTEEMFVNINEFRIIGTASIGTDHIHVPEEKRQLIQIVNAPIANRISVAEHTFALILALAKQLLDAVSIAECGLKKKEMQYAPSDIYGETIGVVGAGGTAGEVLRMAQSFGMKCLCWTRHPENHKDLQNVEFVTLVDLMKNSDIVSVNIPLTTETNGLIGDNEISSMKSDSIFVSLSRPEVTNNDKLFERARNEPNFRVGLDVDADAVFGLWDKDMKNVIVTPHIGGGTLQSRIRMFEEVSNNIVDVINSRTT